MNQVYKVKKNKVGNSVVTSELSKNHNVSSTIKTLIIGGLFISSISYAQTIFPPISITADGFGNVATINESNKSISSTGYPNQSIYSAIYANGTNGADVNITLDNVNLTTNQMWQSGIHANGANIDIKIQGNSTITTGGWQGHGINANVDSSGLNPSTSVTIKNSANIIQTDPISQAGTHGIKVYDGSSSSTNIHIVNNGDMTLLGYKDSRGILIQVDNDSRSNFTSVIENSGTITLNNGIGILSQSKGTNSKATVNNTGNIVVTYTGISGVDKGSLHGIEVTAPNGIATINHSSGSIILNSVNGATSSTSSGLVAYGYFDPTYTEAYINVTGNASVDATMGGFGVEIIGQKGKIYIGQNAKVKGGTMGAGLIGASLGNANGSLADLELENEGVLDSANDQAIYASVLNHKAIINNRSTGTITGYIHSLNRDNPVEFTNEGTWNLRNTYRSVDLADGTYIKDTEAVSISNFGATATGLGGKIINTGTINLVSRDMNLTLDNTNQYKPFGADIMENGASHAQLLQVSEFKHSGNGVIDLTANGTSKGGNVLVISGSNVAGQNGNGNFIADGGSIKFNTVFNEGNTNSKSDMLVVDNVILGNQATKLYVNPVAGSTYVKTEGNGIRLIEVLGTQQDPNAFVLGNAVTYGLYEYRLNSVAGDGYYLTNILKSSNPMNPNNPSSCHYLGNCGWQNPDLIINPNVGSILGGQTAAIHMFSKLGRTFGHYNKSERDRALWVTLTGDQTKYTLFNGRLSNKINSVVLNIGSDIITNEEKTFILGLYLGLGQSEIKTLSRQTGTRSELETRGYTLGAYLLINALKDEGFYMNSWAYYGRFNNEFKGTSFNGLFFNGNKKYKSNIFSINTDIGYKIPLTKDNESPWVLQPKVELSYSNYRGNTFTDYTFTTYSGNRQKGLQSSVGARLYKARLNPNDLGIKPYIEANWLHNTATNKLNVNYENISQKIGKNAFELKIGATGKITNNFDVFGYIAGQKGSGNYKKLEAQIGFRYLF